MNTDLLQQLKGLELPPEPSMWPPAPGWWLLSACALGLLAWSVIQLRRRHSDAAPRRLARVELTRARQAFRASELSANEYADTVNELLKRVLRHYQPAAPELTAFGDEWLAYLDASAGNDDFSKGPGRVLGHDRFRRHVETDWQAFAALIDKTVARIGQ